MRFFVVAGILFVFVLSVTISHTAQATQHGCAPSVPPAVSGTPITPSPTAGSLFINEVLLTPHSVWNCDDTGPYSVSTDSWIELYNSLSSPVDLNAEQAALDTGPSTDIYYLTGNSVIAAHGFLVVFPRTSLAFSNPDITMIRLLISLTPVDSVTLPALGNDISYARVPDGSSTWQTTSTPSIDTSNPQALPTAIPSPTHTPRPTATPRPPKATPTLTKRDLTAMAGSNGQGGANTTNTQGGDSSVANTDTSNASQVDGVQPNWNKMPLPTDTAQASVADTSMNPTDTTPTPPAPTDNNTGIVTKVIITLVIVILALAALLWCRRRFKFP